MSPDHATAAAPVPRLEAVGVGLLLVVASAVVTWRLGPRHVAPLVAGLLLCAVPMVLVDLPVPAVVTVLLAVAIAVRRALA